MDRWDGVTVDHFQALFTTNSDKISDWDHQNKGRAKTTKDSSMSKQTTKPLFLEPTALWKLWPQWVTVPFHNNIVIFSNIFVLSLCYYFEHRPWIVWPCFTNLYKLYFSLIILCQVNKFRKSTMAMAWVKKTRLH